MSIVLPTLPEPAPGETAPYCVMAKHRAKRMMADARKTREEPGALQFHIHRDRFDRNLFVVYEIWSDIDALREHFEKPYVKQFVADSVGYHDGDMEVQWLVMSGEYTKGK